MGGAGSPKFWPRDGQVKHLHWIEPILELSQKPNTLRQCGNGCLYNEHYNSNHTHTPRTHTCAYEQLLPVQACMCQHTSSLSYLTEFTEFTSKHRSNCTHNTYTHIQHTWLFPLFEFTKARIGLNPDTQYGYRYGDMRCHHYTCTCLYTHHLHPPHI